MRFGRTHGAAAVILLCAAAMPAYSQHDGQGQRQEANPDNRGPARPHGNREQAAPARQQQQQQNGRAQQPRQQQAPHQQDRQQQPRQQQARHQQPGRQQDRHQQSWQQQPRQAYQQQQPQRSHEEAQAWQNQQGWQQGGAWRGDNTWQGDRSRNWSSDHRDWAQRGGYGGFYVPQASFSLYFGRDHFFRLGGQPFMYQGYPRFEQDGYSFLLLDPYPQNWPENWYSSDDVYIDYNNGYYLYNRSYPGIGLALTLEM